jgi:hypothetical protein
MTRLLYTGKKAPKRLRKALPLSNYLHMSAVQFPAVMAWERPISLGMLGNDMVGDCTIAGRYHLRMIQRSVAQAGNPLVVTDQQALSDYSAITGYVQGNPSTDNGAAMTDVLTWYKDHYVTIDTQNIDMVKAACFLFGGLYIGFAVPQSLADQLNNGQTPTFDMVPGDKPSGEGHCIDPCGYGRDGFAFASWGTYYRASWDFWTEWVDEAYALVEPDWIKASGVSPSGLDLNGLIADLNQQALS